MSSWWWSPHCGISALVRGNARSLSPSPALPPCEGTTRKQPSATWKRALTRTRPCWPFPVTDFPASRTVRNKCLLFKPPSLWYFVTAALADWDTPALLSLKVKPHDEFKMGLIQAHILFLSKIYLHSFNYFKIYIFNSTIMEWFLQ